MKSSTFDITFPSRARMYTVDKGRGYHEIKVDGELTDEDYKLMDKIIKEAQRLKGVSK